MTGDDELRAYLACGIHGHGFLRGRCSTCRKEILVAFSCKLRGVCPSCNARRTCSTAAHLTDRVFPDVPIRQWVLSVPFELRLLLARSAPTLSAVGRIFVREIWRWQREQFGASLVPARKAVALRTPTIRGGAVCFPQRFGGSLNLNVHYHVAVPDGVFARATRGADATAQAGERSAIALRFDGEPQEQLEPLIDGGEFVFCDEAKYASDPTLVDRA